MSHPQLEMLLARARTDDLYRDAAAARLAANMRRLARAAGHRRPSLSPKLANPQRAVTLRHYSVEDHGPLARIAALDSSKPPPQPLVVAEVQGELRAALSLNDGSLVADPFHLTEGVAALLRAYARQLDDQAEARIGGELSSGSPAMCVEGGPS